MIAEPVVDRRYVAYGGAAEFMRCKDLEVVCESGAGTGKTFSLLWKANYVARKFPGSRQFFARDTRKSLNESVLPDWEQKVLWLGHPAITGTATRDHRDSYTYPNGSHIVLIGLDNVDRHMSTQFDRGYIFEATETTLEAWEKLLSRMRNGMTDYHQLVADCNPGSEFHWINKRADRGTMTRIRYRHEDNPKWYDGTNWTPEGKHYLARVLGNLTGARRERLLYHRWVSEEGQIWPQYDPKSHLVSKVPEMRYYIASVDFGWHAPGCFQVWGVDGDGSLYRVLEVYRKEMTLDEWALAIIDAHKRFPFVRGVADCAEPRSIDFLNDRIGPICGRPIDGVFSAADKSKGKMHGLNQVRDGFKANRIFLVKGALVSRDPWLDAHDLPCCTEEEIPSYVFPKNDEKKPIKELPDPTCPNEGCDALEYAVVYAWKKDFYEPARKWHFAPGTVADAMDLEEIAVKEEWD